MRIQLNNIRNLIANMKFIDIGANLSDQMYQGKYNQSQKHPPDLENVLDRAWKSGMDKIIVTVGTLKEYKETLDIVQKDDRLFMTMGCHPTRCSEFIENPKEYYNDLCKAIDANPGKIVAIGECGLDYDRLHFCPAETQRTYFEYQLDLVAKYKLPLFLHCRNSFDDFFDIIKRNAEKITNGGVVHSFDGTIEEAQKFIDFGFYIGINGCSMKTEDQLKTVVQLPNDKILIETDCPWCSIRNSHAGSKFIKTKFPSTKKKENWSKDLVIDGRYEPAQIVQVLEVIAGAKHEDIETLANQYYKNTIDLFFSKI